MIPVAVFVYKRLDHLERTINSLKDNYLCKKVDLKIFSDGPKTPKDRISVDQVRIYIRSLSGFAEISIIESVENLGLSKSIISGISKVLEKYDRIIVIEDDLELSPYFLTYMNEALNLYQDTPQVASIHGYTFPVKSKLPDTFFLKGADCWGWATWKRAWDTFEKDGSILLERLKKSNAIKEFDFEGLVGNSQMLKDQIAGKNDSWAIRWHASCFLNNMLTLHPGKSLVKNIGFDGSGEHCNTDDTYRTELSQMLPKLEFQTIVESKIALQAYKEFYKMLRPTFLRRVLRKVKSFLVSIYR